MAQVSVSSAFRCAQRENKMHVLVDLDLDDLIWLYRSIPTAMVCLAVPGGNFNVFIFGHTLF